MSIQRKILNGIKLTEVTVNSLSLPSSCITHPTLMVFHHSLGVLASMHLLHAAQDKETVSHESLLAVEPYTISYISQLIYFVVVLVQDNSQMHPSISLGQPHILPCHWTLSL